MIVILPDHLELMTSQAEAAYPNECCGLIAGMSDKHDNPRQATRIVPSANVTDTSARDSFEIDPQVRFDLMRDLEHSDEDIIGHYHSHPDHPAVPSPTDLSMAYEPDLTWVILSVRQGQVVDTRAYGVSADATSFHDIEISTPRPTGLSHT